MYRGLGQLEQPAPTMTVGSKVSGVAGNESSSCAVAAWNKEKARCFR
jgi:hypothetical protein